MSITSAELTRMKGRAEKANAESWFYNRHNEILTGRGARLAQVVCGTDAEFIAHAREDVPRLVAEVDRLQTYLTQIHESLDNFYTREHKDIPQWDCVAKAYGLTKEAMQ